MTGIRLRYITLTGPNTDPAELIFENGLNIIYGASNTGKSFVSKAILFMLGASNSLPETEEILAYDASWLGLTLPDKREVTIYRSTRGGHFKLYEGLIKGGEPENGQVFRLKHDSKRTDTISHLLLDAMGFSGKQIVRDGNGTKDSLSIRLLSPYAVVSEGDIMAEKSPVFSSGNPSERLFEQNLFKLLLSGIDDSAVVTVRKPTERKVAKVAKIELVDEMVALVDAELGSSAPNQKEAAVQLDQLDQNANGLFSRLQDTQKDQDSLILERRNAQDRRRELQDRLGELVLTLHRFAQLESVYNSDLQRLQSIEEGGYILVAMAGMDCPVCGAPPEVQKHNHAGEEISMAHKAAAAEARKIEREQRELVQTITSLEAETSGLRQTIDQLESDIKLLNAKIEEARPQEASLRASYEAYASKRVEIIKIIDLYEQRTKLIARRGEIASEPTKRVGEAPPVGPDSTTVFKFGETVKAVLTA